MDLFTRAIRTRSPRWAPWLIVNTILYVARTGSRWRTRSVPNDDLPWPTVYVDDWRWTRSY